MEPYTLAIDLGGTNTKFALVTKDLRIEKEMSFPTEAQWGAKIAVEKWLDALQPWFKQYKIDLIGLGSPGPIDAKRGMILESPNLKSWTYFSFTDFFKSRLNIPCVIENDANCAAFGEWSFEKIPNLIVLTLGTGVGSGIVSEGKLILGAGGLATEAGHMVIDRSGLECGCGRRGCFETFVGGVYLTRKYKERSQKEASAHEIFSKAAGGEKTAQELVQEWTYVLALGIGNLVNIFNPQKVVLTGGLSKGFPTVEADFKKILLTQAFKESLKWCDVAVSRLQDKAGLIGAAAWAQTQQ